MSDYSKVFLLTNLALAFYLVCVIWAHEIDIFRSWRLIAPKDFHTVQEVHWRKLPYWVFTPLGLALLGSLALIWYHPSRSPAWAIIGNLACLVLAYLLTAIFWGRWQARLSKDSAGSQSIYLAKILSTHWVRTLLITVYAVILFAWAIKVLT